MTFLLQPHVWTDGHDFVITTTGVERWTLLCYCKHMWTDRHDFVIATIGVKGWT